MKTKAWTLGAALTVVIFTTARPVLTENGQPTGVLANCIVYLADDTEIVVEGTDTQPQCSEEGKVCADGRPYRQILFLFSPVMSGVAFSRCDDKRV